MGNWFIFWLKFSLPGSKKLKNGVQKMAVVFSIVDSDLASKKHSFVVDDVDDDVDGRNVMSVFLFSDNSANVYQLRSSLSMFPPEQQTKFCLVNVST